MCLVSDGGRSSLSDVDAGKPSIRVKRSRQTYSLSYREPSSFQETLGLSLCAGGASF